MMSGRLTFTLSFCYFYFVSFFQDACQLLLQQHRLWEPPAHTTLLLRPCGCLPASLSADFRGLSPPCLCVGSLGQGEQQREQRIPLQKAVREAGGQGASGRNTKNQRTMGALWSTNACPSHYPPIAQMNHTEGLSSGSPESKQGLN